MGLNLSDAKDVIELTDSNFDKLVLNSDAPWLVEFYAPWCGNEGYEYLIILCVVIYVNLLQ